MLASNSEPSAPYHEPFLAFLPSLQEGQTNHQQSLGRFHGSYRFSSHAFVVTGQSSVMSFMKKYIYFRNISIHRLLKALSSPSGGPVQRNPTVSLTLAHWYCPGVVWFELFSRTMFDIWMSRQGAAALHCIVDTIPPRTVPVKFLRYTSRMLNFDVSQSPAIVSSCLTKESKYDLPLLPSKFVHWVTLLNQHWLYDEERYDTYS